MDVETLLNSTPSFSMPGSLQTHGEPRLPDPPALATTVSASAPAPPSPPLATLPAMSDGSNLVRVTSTGSGVDSTHGGEVSAQPAVPQGNVLEEPPPPPPPPEPQFNPEETHSEEQQATLAYYTSMLPMPEDTSDPDEKELRQIESSNEHLASESAYWERKAFKDLNDAEYTTSGTGRFEWVIPRLHGTKENPNTDIIMRSPSFTVGAHEWKLKFFPKGNQSSYFAIYLECQDFINPETRDAVDRVQPMLQIPGQDALQRPRQVPTQFSIVMFNPAEPRVHVHKSATHAFSKQSPDRGFQRFGGTQFYNLGMRHRYQRKALILNDTVGFFVYIRTLKDPTACLFAEMEDGKWNSFAMNGLHGLYASNTSMGSNIISAVSTWSMLAPFRNVIYSIKLPDPDQEPRATPMPLVTAFQQLFYLIRSPSKDENFAVAVDDVQNALMWHGASILESYDVIATWEVLRDVLEKEIEYTPQAGAIRDLFAHGGFRAQIDLQGPIPISSVQQGLSCTTSQAPTGKDGKWPKILQIELGRQGFDRSVREWRKIEDKLTVNSMISLRGKSNKTGKESSNSVSYLLYGFVCHRGGLRYGSYFPIIRPSCLDWYKFTCSRDQNLVYRLTQKQATSDAETSAYLAMYVRSDIAAESIISRSPSFKGAPESLTTVPKFLVESAAPLLDPAGEPDSTACSPATTSVQPVPNESVEVEICYSRSIVDYRGPGIVNLIEKKGPIRSHVAKRRLQSNSTIAGVKRLLSEDDQSTNAAAYRLWAMDLRGGSIFRPRLYELEDETCTVHKFASEYPERRVWLHVPSPSDFTPQPKTTPEAGQEAAHAEKTEATQQLVDVAPADESGPAAPRSVYFFVKLFDTKSQVMYGVGSYIASATEQVGASIRMRAFPQVSKEKRFDLYEETECSGAIPVHAKHTFQSLGLENGCIIIAQPELSAEEEDQVLLGGGLVQPTTFLHHLYQHANQISSPEQDASLAKQQDLPGATYKRNYFGGEYHIGHQSKGCLHGEGVHYYFSGDVYHGTYKMGVRNGKGKMTFQNGDVYEGDWEDDRMHGKGKYVDKISGNAYEGGFKDGKKHGQGTTQWMRVEQDVRLCLICLEREQDCAFYDCGHVCACLECASTVSKCPICRKDNVRAMKLFF